MARLRPDAFPKGPRTGKTPVRGNISPACIQIQLILARYARHASEKTRRAPLGNTPREHLAAKGRFRRPKPPESCTARESCHPPMDSPLRRGSCPSNCIAGSPFNGLALAQGRLPQRLANTRRLPMPATCQCLPLAAPIAVRDKPPMGFGGGHPAHGLQSGQAPRDRRLRRLDGRADNGMLRRAGPGFQNREQAGAEPQAEAAGPAGPAAALPKTPIERTSPSWRNYRNTPRSRKGVRRLVPPLGTAKARAADVPPGVSRNCKGAPPGISLKEDEMRATPCISKCSTRCAVGYRIRICFEYQSMPLLE